MCVCVYVRVPLLLATQACMKEHPEAFEKIEEAGEYEQNRREQQQQMQEEEEEGEQEQETVHAESSLLHPSQTTAS